MVDLKLNLKLGTRAGDTYTFINELAKKAKGTTITFEKLKNLMDSAMDSIKKFAVGAVAAFTGLAFVSPTVQSNLARMKKPLFEIGETLGKALEPGLKIGVSLLKDFSAWLKENTWLTEGLESAFTTIIGVASTLWEKLKNLMGVYVKPVVEWAMSLDLGTHILGLVDKFGYTILGALIGWKLGGPWGALLAGSLGLAADIWRGAQEGEAATVDQGTMAYTGEPTTEVPSGLSLLPGGGTVVNVSINGVPGVEDVNIEES